MASPQYNVHSSQDIWTMLPTMVTSLIVQKFQLSTVYYGLMFAIVTKISTHLQDIENIQVHMDKLPYVVCILIIYTIYKNITSIRDYLTFFTCKKQENINNKKQENINNNKYIKIIIKDKEHIITIMGYIQKFPKVILDDYDTIYGSYHYNDYNKRQEYYYNSITDSKINFNDKELKIKGYIQWTINKNFGKMLELKNSEDKNSSSHMIGGYDHSLNVYSYPTLYIEKGDPSITRTNIVDKIKTKLKKTFIDTVITTKYYRFDKYDHNNGEILYNGEPVNIEDNEKIYMDTFFHKEKSRLWEYIKRVDQSPEMFIKFGQSPSANLLLYGPPGTGKSSFAYRVAMCLSRNILSIDLRNVTKKELYKAITNYHIGYDKCLKPCEYVVVLEEFDIGIKYLYMQEKINKDRQEYWEKNMWDNFKKNDSTDDELKIDDKNAKEKKNSKCKKKYKTYDIIDIDEEKLCLKDLLEIFQGTVPHNGSIIIATTNEYKEIKELCPALFRPGRMTPVLFDHMDEERLQELSQQYFNKQLSIKLPKRMPIPTSQIVELALEAHTSVDENKFMYFQNKLDMLLQQ